MAEGKTFTGCGRYCYSGLRIDVRVNSDGMRDIRFRVWDNADYMSGEFTLQDLQERKIEFTPECIVMQSTGLKDKNGILIFEGDLIKSINITMYGGVREIKWHDQICAWVGKWELVKPILLYDFVNPEVIGNIFEHKHLLQ